MNGMERGHYRARMAKVVAASSILLGAALALLPAPLAAPAARAIANAVAIDSSGFHPDLLHVLVGQSVAWSNFDTVEHTVTSKWPGAKPTPTPTPAAPSPSSAPSATPAPSFDMVLGPGESDSLTFAASGEFEYYCRDHPDETGTVIVLVADLTTPSPSPGLPDNAYLPGDRPPGMLLTVLGIVLMTAGALIALASAGGEPPNDTIHTSIPRDDVR